MDLDEHIRSRINQSMLTDCRTFSLRGPTSTAFKTVLYTVDEGLRGRKPWCELSDVFLQYARLPVSTGIV